jgi:hypothetical protein
MEERTGLETMKIENGDLMAQIARIIHEGNVRRIMIRQGGQVIAEFPLSVGVVGAVIAPIAAAVGALAALLTDCRIEVERATPAPLAGEPAKPVMEDPTPIVVPGD